MALFRLPPTLKVRLDPTKAVSLLERMPTMPVKPKDTSETCPTPACSPVPGGLGGAGREEELRAGAWRPQAEPVLAGWSLAQGPLTAPTAVWRLLQRAWDRVVPVNNSVPDPDGADEHGLPSTQGLVVGGQTASWPLYLQEELAVSPKLVLLGLLEKARASRL